MPDTWRYRSRVAFHQLLMHTFHVCVIALLSRESYVLPMKKFCIAQRLVQRLQFFIKALQPVFASVLMENVVLPWFYNYFLFVLAKLVSGFVQPRHSIILRNVESDFRFRNEC